LWQDVNGKQDEQLQAAVSSQTSSLQVSRHAWALCVSLTPFEHRILTITRATVLTLTLALARLFKPR
jgi:CO dehydrogenase/acetyl-CoA synthase delta subunit